MQRQKHRSHYPLPCSVHVQQRLAADVMIFLVVPAGERLAGNRVFVCCHVIMNQPVNRFVLM